MMYFIFYIYLYNEFCSMWVILNLAKFLNVCPALYINNIC